MRSEMYQSSAFDIGPEFPLTLAETYSDADLKNYLTATVAGFKPGMTKWVDSDIAKYTGKLKPKPNATSASSVLLYGSAIVSLVCNRDATILAQGECCKWYTAAVTASAGSLTTFTAATTANKQVGNFLYILDNNNSAGAAPESEARLIIKNTATVMTVQPAFSALVEANDTGIIFSRSQVIATASGDDRMVTAGIVLAPDGIAPDYWGFVVRKGLVAAKMDTTTTVTAGRALKAGTRRLAICGGATLYYLTLAHTFLAQTNDVVSDLLPVDFDCWSPQASGA